MIGLAAPAMARAEGLARPREEGDKS